jgi:uncharacterized membrane protein YqjE
MKSGLLHLFAFATKKNQRAIIFAAFTASALWIMRRIVFWNANRLSAQGANTFRIGTARISAGTGGPSNFSDAPAKN